MEDHRQIHSYRVYERYLRREKIAHSDVVLLTPTREELAALYRMLATLRGAKCGIESALGALKQVNMTVGKLLLCLEIMRERGLIEYELSADCVQARLLRQSGKVDIMASAVLKNLAALQV